VLTLQSNEKTKLRVVKVEGYFTPQQNTQGGDAFIQGEKGKS
jgi:hypothetical protein